MTDLHTVAKALRQELTNRPTVESLVYQVIDAQTDERSNLALQALEQRLMKNPEQLDAAFTTVRTRGNAGEMSDHQDQQFTAVFGQLSQIQMLVQHNPNKDTARTSRHMPSDFVLK